MKNNSVHLKWFGSVYLNSTSGIIPLRLHCTQVLAEPDDDDGDDDGDDDDDGDEDDDDDDGDGDDGDGDHGDGKDGDHISTAACFAV